MHTLWSLTWNLGFLIVMILSIVKQQFGLLVVNYCCYVTLISQVAEIYMNLSTLTLLVKYMTFRVNRR